MTEEKGKTGEEETSNYEDKTQQIPYCEVKKYAERSHDAGRHVYNNGSILPSKYNKPAVDRLVDDEKILKPEHKSAAETFKAIVDCAEGRLVAARFSELIEDPWITPALYVRAVYHQLTKRQEYYINRVVFGTFREHEYGTPKQPGWLRQCRGTLNDAFDALIEAMRKENALGAVEQIRKKELDKEPRMGKIIDDYRAHSAAKISPKVVYN